MDDEIPDYNRALGGAALGARLRRISERMDRDSTRIYAARGLQFEQRWFGILNQIVRNGPMSVGDIAGALRISHASVSQARRSLELADLVQSLSDDADARRRQLTLTPRGAQFVKDLRPLWQALEVAAQQLNAESGDVVALLDRLEDAMDARSLFDRVTDESTSAPAGESSPEPSDA